MAHTFLVIGEKCLDVFVYGEVNRLSPEAPIPVFNPIERVKNDGMAKNVYNNLFSLIGKENKNHEIYGIFSSDGNVKTRYVEQKSNHSFLRVDENDIAERIDFSKYNKSIIKKADCIIISDYNKGFLSEEDILQIVKFKKENAIVFLDTKKKILKSTASVVDFIKFNTEEAERNKDLKDYFPKKIIITRGSKGAYYNNMLFFTTDKVTTDVSGAGDTFLAALSFYYMVNKKIGDAILKANECALEVVSKRGVSVI